MRLRSKFIILIGLILGISYGVTFYRTSAFQQELVLDQVARQARMLQKQVLMTRKWVADHNGLFFLKKEGVGPNPFLNEPEIVDTAGRQYVKRNPAMVTRELSEYVSQQGLFRYRVTTLKTINPANAPDEFEKKSLLLFEKGVSEVVEIEKQESGKVLRYIAPLFVEESCLECHADQGYKVGDIRGALSVSIPVDWAYQNIAKNNKMLLLYAVITISVVGIAIFLLIDFLVVRRLGVLSRAMDSYPQESTDVTNFPSGNDEVGKLATDFRDLCNRLTTSQQELDRTREQVFQNEKLAALGRLSAGVAHEINNPLGGMLNCVKSMRENPDDREMNQRYLELLEKGLKRIGHTVNQLLNFGRREPLRLRKIHVDELIRECMALLEYALKNVDLTLDLALPGPMAVDVEALRQVVVNIGLNAIQAMPDGGKLAVKSRKTASSIVLSFKDSGEGIAEENLSKIFDPFFTTKDVGVGTGLGLAVTHSLVQRMGGTISVESREGEGACFTVELPIAEESND